MSRKKKKKIDLSKYEHLFDGTYMLLGTKLKRLEELIKIVKDAQADNIRLKKELKIWQEKVAAESKEKP